MNLIPVENKDEAALRGYLYTVATNESYNILRGKKDFVSEDEVPEQPDGADLAVKAAEGEEFEFAVSAMRNMDDTYRAPLYLRYVMGFSLKETAQHLGRSEATVRSQVSRGLQILKKTMTEAGYES